MTTLETLKDKYTEVRQRIAVAAKRGGRSAESVMLIAVTKTAEPDQIRELIKLGHADFGENRVQQLIQRAAIIDEWMGRQRTMPGVQWQRGDTGEMLQGAAAKASGTGLPPVIRWHMIGHLQRNKARKAVELCRLIHSVDSLRLAEELQLIGLKREKPIEVLLQVNCSLEAQKYGCAIAAAAHLAEQIETMVHVQVRGLMTMAAADADQTATRKTFERCRELFEEIRESGMAGQRFNILSMGMSGDYEAAIEEGANMVRVGTALFGEPKPGMSDGADDEDDE
jgi:pyridoxal phosphate enzyme (YggS family)